MSENESVMIEREKVIDYLEYHINLLYDVIPHVSRDDGEYLEAAAKTMSDALALLKAHEPRLVTKVDFENADAYGYLPVWVEYKDGEIICDCITITAITNLDMTCDYRFWTSKPSDEQRKAVKWE